MNGVRKIINGPNKNIIMFPIKPNKYPFLFSGKCDRLFIWPNFLFWKQNHNKGCPPVYHLFFLVENMATFLLRPYYLITNLSAYGNLTVFLFRLKNYYKIIDTHHTPKVQCNRNIIIFSLAQLKTVMK